MKKNNIDKIEELCKIYNKVKSLRKVRKITGHSINYIKKCIKGKVQFPIYPRPLKEGFEKISVEKVRLYAHTVFDGYISHSKGNSYTVGYVNKNKELLDEFQEDIKSVYGIKPTISETRKDIFTIICSSKLMYYDLNNFDRTKILEDDEYKRVYLRAFFDDEGCVMFRPEKGKFVINGCQHNHEEILFIQNLLKDFNIESNSYKFSIEITKIRSIVRYKNLIGFTNPDKKARMLRGIGYHKNKSEIIKQQNSKIKKLVDKGLNPYKISKIINMPPSTIRNRIKVGLKYQLYDGLF